MFAHIRRHQKWLWILISAAVIISFVWLFSPTQQMQGGSGDVRSHVGSIYGDPITLRQYWDARREAELDYLFRNGQWAENDEFARQMRVIERETRNRLLLTRKLNDLGIKVDDRATADWISTFFSDRETKRFNRETLDRLLQTIQQKGYRQVDFERYARHQVGIQHLVAVAGSPGKLVTPQEATQALHEQHEKIDTKLVVFPLSNYLAKVQITPEAIGTYYTNSMARYRLPERMQLSYVAFPASNYFAQAEQKMTAETNLNQQIDIAYMQRGPQFYTGPDGQPLTPEAAKQKIREEMRNELSLMEARKAAFALATDLENAPKQPNSANPAEPLEQLATAKGFTPQLTKPFSQFEGPTELPGLPEQFSRAVFQLTPEQPIVPEPIAGENAVYLLALKRKLESELQPLDAIREQVTEDFRRGEGLKLARDTANAFIAAATNAPAGANFDAAAQQNGLAVVDLPPFSRDAAAPVENLPPLVDSGALRSAAGELSPGGVSSYVPTREGGFVLLLEKTIPPTAEEIQRELPQFVQDYRRRNASESFNEWFMKEMQLAQLTLNDGSSEADQGN
jgi:peptidyl-prolyl cis-trans isomerase D